MENSRFFQIALGMINTETKKLESFCDTLDKKPPEKKNRIPEYVAVYENTADGEKQDFALYYGHIAFADSEITKLESKLENVTNWEKVELEERIGGLQFAKECLNEAWQRRKEVIQ